MTGCFKVLTGWPIETSLKRESHHSSLGGLKKNWANSVIVTLSHRRGGIWWQYQGSECFHGEWGTQNSVRSVALSNIQGGANVGLQLFIWKIIRWLINNNTGINSVFWVLATVSRLLPHPVYILIMALRMKN